MVQINRLSSGRLRGAIAVAALAVAWSAVPARGAFTMGDIVNWTGTGSNSAGLVIDWNDGTAHESMAWGYRWNGTATSENMLDAIVASSSNLYALVTDAASSQAYGTFVFGFGYDHNGDGSLPVTPSLTFNAQHLAFTDFSHVDEGPAPIPIRTPVDAGDRWAEGLVASDWSFQVGTAASLTGDPSQFTDASLGIGSTTLTNGDWNAFVFEPNGYPQDDMPALPEAAPAAVPEPATAGIVLAAGMAGLARRRRRA